MEPAAQLSEIATSSYNPGTTLTFLKVCGICSLEDGRVCADLGVDAVGLLLEKRPGEIAQSSDRISVAAAKTFVGYVRSQVLPVLLIHETNVAAISELCNVIQPGALQVQSELAPSQLLGLKAVVPPPIDYQDLPRRRRRDDRRSDARYRRILPLWFRRCGAPRLPSGRKR